MRSVHRGRVHTCARARVCRACVSVCCAGVPDEPTRAGDGSPVPELPNYRPRLGARGLGREAESVGTRHPRLFTERAQIMRFFIGFILFCFCVLYVTRAHVQVYAMHADALSRQRVTR